MSQGIVVFAKQNHKEDRAKIMLIARSILFGVSFTFSLQIPMFVSTEFQIAGCILTDYWNCMPFAYLKQQFFWRKYQLFKFVADLRIQ